MEMHPIIAHDVVETVRGAGGVVKAVWPDAAGAICVSLTYAVERRAQT